MFDMSKLIPNMDSDTTSDGCHLLGLLACVGMAVNVVFFHVDAPSGGLMLAGILFAGGIVNSKVNGTPGQ